MRKSRFTESQIVSVAEFKRLKGTRGGEREAERMYAEHALENAAIKDVLSRKL